MDFDELTKYKIARPLWLLIFAIVVVFLILPGKEGQNMTKSEHDKDKIAKYNVLTPAEAEVILKKGTESPYTGKYYKNKAGGVYTCKQCDAPLYSSQNKFDSDCGWPSFDDELFRAVKRQSDSDGRRTEILCANCDAHLGHVFLGEGFTSKNTRHCVNSISMNFVPLEKTERAIFASGCFWGTEYHFKKVKGVLLTSAGFTGGHVKSPYYQQVCAGTTGHAEAIEVIFDPTKVSYEDLTKLYFETHDPTQINRQGPDVGEQYRSEIFYVDEHQKETAQKLVDQLKSKGYKVATRLTPASPFWKAEDYHQDYYQKKNGTPYCHIYTKRF